MQDISNRVYEKLSKFSQGQLESLFTELHFQNDVLKSIVQSLSTGLVCVDKNWKLIEMNNAAERMLPLNLSSEEIKDRGKRFFEFIEDGEMAAFFKDCCENNKTNLSDEYTTQTSSGTVRFIEVTVSPLIKEQEISGSIILIQDITEKRNQEILLHRMETLAGLTNIAASVAHEIKNPLGAISIHIQLLQKALKKKREGDGLLPEPKYAENYLEIVNQEIERLNKIVVDFLMAVRPISAQLTLVKPDTILSQFIDFFTPEFTEKKIRIETEFCKDCPKLLIDEKLFREVIVNLAQNSLAAITERFSSNSKAHAFEEVMYGKLSITTYIKEDKYYLIFKDNGCGMSSAVKERVFEPYYTTKANGTGLGMAMAYKIIKEFSGDISVESVQGEGTEFTITIPVPQTQQKLLVQKKSSQEDL